MEATKFMTAVFQCDLRSVRGNPHRIDTPFGCAEAVAIGNMLEEHHNIEQLNTALLDALIHIQEYWNGSRTEGAMSDALDEILATARAAIAKATA